MTRVHKLEKERAILEQRLKSHQSKMQELSRIKPKDMAAVVQAGVINDIREQEIKLSMKHPHDKDIEPQLPSRINRFERQETDLTTYQKKIEELRQNEKDKQTRHEYEAFRKELFVSAGSRRLPQTNKPSAEQKFYQRLLDQFEPISKERNRELLQRIEEGIKRVDPRTDEKPFKDLFSDYVDQYKNFMDGTLVYHENRLQQGQALEEIQRMGEIASQSNF